MAGMTVDELFNEQPAPDVRALATQTAMKHGVDPGLVHAVVQQESGFNQDAVSPKGAVGLMQLMPKTAAQFGIDPTDPAQNLDGGVKYLAFLNKKYKGDTEKVLAAYNFGPGNVDAGKPLPKETRAYVKNVMNTAGLKPLAKPQPSLNEFAVPEEPATIDQLFSQSDRGGMAGMHNFPTSQTGDRPGAASSLFEMSKTMALPTLGQAAGIGAGMLTGPAAPLAVPVLEGLGGAAGEALNQRLGITEPSTTQIALQGALPAVFRGASAVFRAGRPILPPTTKGAEFLNRIASEEARLQMGKLAKPDAAALFNRAFESGAHFHTGNTVPAINSELRNLTRGANADQLYGRTITILRNLRSKLEDGGGYLNPRDYQTELRDLGAALRTAEGRTINKVEQGAIKKVYAELASALDAESIPRRGPAGRTFAEHEPAAINPEVVPDDPGTALQVVREPATIFRGQQTHAPLQPNVPSTQVNLPGFQPTQPAVRSAGVPGVRQADEIIPAAQGPQRSRPDIHVHPGEEVPPSGAAGTTQRTGTGNRGNQNAMAAQDLIQARTYVKRQAVLDDIDESITKAEKILRGQGENVQFNGAQVLRDLKENPFWTGEKGGRNPAFTPQEKRYVEQLFTLLNKIPVLQPGAGVNAGSMRVMGRGMMAGTAGTGAFAASGDPLVSMAVAGAGAAIPTISAFWQVARLAMRTETGRNELLSTLRRATQSGASLENVLSLLTGAGVAATATRPKFQAGPTAMPTPFGLER